MSLVYLDTSALIKEYIDEAGSEWVRALIAPDPTSTVFVSRLAAIEAACTFARRRREGTLSAADYARVLALAEYDFAYRYNVLDVDLTLVDAAKRFADRHPLRAYDAVQLATAWQANDILHRAGQPPLMFVTADDRLLVIAQAEGLLTDNPHHHP
jgi:hypothetical protein